MRGPTSELLHAQLEGLCFSSCLLKDAEEMEKPGPSDADPGLCAEGQEARTSSHLKRGVDGGRARS